MASFVWWAKPDEVRAGGGRSEPAGASRAAGGVVAAGVPLPRPGSEAKPEARPRPDRSKEHSTGPGGPGQPEGEAGPSSACSSAHPSGRGSASSTEPPWERQSASSTAPPWEQPSGRRSASSAWPPSGTPLVPDRGFPSAGSLGHPALCRPPCKCAASCRASCSYCHLPHEARRQQLNKANRQTLRLMGRRARIEALRRTMQARVAELGLGEAGARALEEWHADVATVREASETTSRGADDDDDDDVQDPEGSAVKPFEVRRLVRFLEAMHLNDLCFVPGPHDVRAASLRLLERLRESLARRAGERIGDDGAGAARGGALEAAGAPPGPAGADRCQRRGPGGEGPRARAEADAASRRPFGQVADVGGRREEPPGPADADCSQRRGPGEGPRVRAEAAAASRRPLGQVADVGGKFEEEQSQAAGKGAADLGSPAGFQPPTGLEVSAGLITGVVHPSMPPGLGPDDMPPGLSPPQELAATMDKRSGDTLDAEIGIQDGGDATLRIQRSQDWIKRVMNPQRRSQRTAGPGDLHLPGVSSIRSSGETKRPPPAGPLDLHLPGSSKPRKTLSGPASPPVARGAR